MVTTRLKGPEDHVSLQDLSAHRVNTLFSLKSEDFGTTKLNDPEDPANHKTGARTMEKQQFLEDQKLWSPQG